jgi:hypothetical protein
MSRCYQCGNPEGTDLQLCPDCDRTYEAKREALRRNLRVNTDASADSFVHKLFCNSRFQANMLVVAWYLLTFVLVLLGTEVGVSIGVSLVISTLITSAALFFATLLLSWLSLMVFDLVQGLIVLLLPFMLYRMFLRIWRFRFVNSDWESHKGIILAHLLSIVLFCSAINSIPLVGNMALLRADRLFERNYGFSPVKPLIAVGLVRKSLD